MDCRQFHKIRGHFDIPKLDNVPIFDPTFQYSNIKGFQPLAMRYYHPYGVACALILCFTKLCFNLRRIETAAG